MLHVDESEPDRGTARDERHHVDAVEQHEEGDHALGELPRADPTSAQGPDGHRRAAETRGREEPRGRRSGEADVVGVAPAQVRARSRHDPVQEQDVSADGSDLEEPAGEDQSPVRVQGTLEGSREARAVRDDEGREHPGRDDREERSEPCEPRRSRRLVGSDLAHEPGQVGEPPAGRRQRDRDREDARLRARERHRASLSRGRRGRSTAGQRPEVRLSTPRPRARARPAGARAPRGPG